MSKTSAAANLTVALAEPAVMAAGQFLTKQVAGFLGDLGTATTEKAYKGLTQAISMPKSEERSKMKPAEAANLFKGKGGQWLSQGGKQIRDESVTSPGTTQVPTFDTPSGQWQMRATKEKGDYPTWARGLYENPETTARVAGAGSVGTAVAATALAGHWLAGMGKPKSAYSLPVNNPNIMASNASFQNQSMLEQQRFEHRMMIERAREQSRVPGPQNIDQGGYGGVDPYKLNPSSAFSDADMLGIARGIYGSGMRL